MSQLGLGHGKRSEIQGSENTRTQAVISHRIFCNILNEREITRFFLNFILFFYYDPC